MPTLDWIGKKAVGHHRVVPFHLLNTNQDLSVGKSGSGNLLVHGDNLLALKALLPYYAGKVKCIYIDPPYNTGNENWTYNDNVNSSLIGLSNGTAVYLLYNGILGDRAPRGGNVLTSEVLSMLPPNKGLRVVYGTACRLSPNRLKKEGIVFRQIPYEIRVS